MSEDARTDADNVSINRRNVMKAVGGAGVISGGFTGIATATDNDCGGCAATSGPANCSCVTDDAAGDCTFLSKTQIGDVECADVQTPEDTTHIGVKAGNTCLLYGDDSHEDVNPGGTTHICVDKSCQSGISHVEFYSCASATVTVDCAADQATIDFTGVDSVYYELDYVHCDEADTSGTLSTSGGTVSLADCEGTISVYTEEGGTLLDSASFDCETASVTVDCANSVANIHADDTSTINYSITYSHCDADDASGSLDFSSTDDQTVTVANCEGSITLTDDDGRTLATDSFDCETASVSVDCQANEATISAPDTDEVWYAIDYGHCDESDVSQTSVDLSTTDSTTVPIADCEGTITITDNNDTELASAHFDCETASVAVVDCVDDFARIHAEDTTTVNYTVEYVHCDEADASGTLDFSSTDDLTIDLVDCEGTITLTDDDGKELDSQNFDCETASVSVDCPNDIATISAPDTDEVWYEISYDHCDESDVSRTKLDFSSTDTKEISIADCEGSITLTDDDGMELDSQTFDCESASVEVDCPSNTATISATDTDSVTYTIDYVHCDESDVTDATADLSGATDSVPVSIASCEGTITLHDDDGTELDTATFDCETASIAEVDCPEDVARVHAEDTTTVNYTVDYVHCDASDASGTLDFSSTDDLTVPVANCEGTITLTDDDGRELDSATFDCETASVSVDCPSSTATISATDTDEVWYAIDYNRCDEADVSRTSVDLSGDTDSVDVSVASCEGTITLTDDDDVVLDSASFDCETASVSVDCPNNHATISAPDTDKVFYTIDYVHCDAADVTETEVDLSGTTDSVNVPVANCEGTIEVTDNDGRVLDTAGFDCETATIQEVDCANDVARVHAEDTASVNYTVDYVHCDASDASGTLDFSSTDDLTVPVANCEGTITLTDDDGRELDSATFDCETATVAVDCQANEATIEATDTSSVWYEIDYNHCDIADVSRQQAPDLSGDTDMVTVDVADCEGTITITDDDGNQLDSATFDCEVATVEAVCDGTNGPVATISSDATGEVFYTIDYVDCDANDVTLADNKSVDLSGSTDNATVSLAECDGTITIYDDDDRELGSDSFACETVDTITVDCANDEISVTATDTNDLWYEITYSLCEAADVSRTKVPDLSDSVDTGTITGVADCSGTISIFADESSSTALATKEFECATATVDVNCATDEATITADDTTQVQYEVVYEHCDASDVGPTSVDLSGDNDTVSVDIADCEGTINVTDSAGNELATHTFDCETATVAVDCETNEATITAPDTDEVWYAIDYEHCDVGDVTRTGPLDLSGATDEVTVDVADCEGTITVTDDDETVLATADFDCETASVSVDCTANEATISATDTDEVWYAIDYEHCDVGDVSRTGPVDLSGSTDSTTVPVADCEGTITVTDDDETVLATADFDCETASVSVDCDGDVATVTANDTSSVHFDIDYVHCDAADASGTLDFSGTDEHTLTIADCEGTISLTDDDGRELDSADFDCETASIDIDCVAEEATITADDTSEVFYTITYDDTCPVGDVSKTSLDLSGGTDSGTVDIADCSGTITVTDDDDTVLASADFDCVPTVESVTATCDTVTVTFGQNAVTDEFEITVTAKDTGGTAVGTVTATRTVDTTLQEAIDYGSQISGTWSSVDVTVDLLDGGTRTLHEENVSIAEAPCGCVPCESDELLVKYEWDEDDGVFRIEGESDPRIELLSVSLDEEGEPIEACFTTSYCELDAKVKAGQETKIYADQSGEFCVEALTGETGSGKEETFAISHVAFYCEAPEGGPGQSGGGPPGLSRRR